MEQVVFSGVLQTLVSAGGIVIAMCTIPPVAKKGGGYSNYWKIPYGSRPMNLID